MDFTSPLVLLIEDNEDDVFFVQYAFQRAGIDCSWHVAGNAEDAILYLSGEGAFEDRFAHPLPAAVLLDIVLPRKSGHDVLAWMRNQKALDKVIRVVLTGSNNPADVDRSYALGAHGYFFKPVTQEQLSRPGRNLKTMLSAGRSPSLPPAFA